MCAQQTPSEVSRHKCLIYDGHPSEQLPVVVPFLIDSLNKNWRSMYLGGPEAVDMVDSALSGRGVDTMHEMKRGALMLSSDRRHLANGHFDPQRMVEMLSGLVDQAVSDGYEGLSATGDMRWELGPDKNFERLLEYEALLEQVFRDKPLRGICQYHRDVIPAQAVREALITHQSVYLGDILNRDNLFYIPPEVLLETHSAVGTGKHGEWMCQQLVRVLEAEHKRDEALHALAEANRNLECRIKERTAELELANRNLEAFSSAVSHDLRAPLRSIIGFSDILAEEYGDSFSRESRGCLERVRASARQMGDLIEGLLTLSRAVRAEIRHEPIDLSRLAEDVARETRETDPESTTEVVIAPDMRAMGDRVLIRAVMANLLGNAWKFTSKIANARIEVGEQMNGPHDVVFFVKDNGAGFDMKYAEKLFTAFQRLHKYDEFPGTGIGLATVQKIILRHGGRIWVESHPNQGATFFFTLPLESHLNKNAVA